MEKPLCTDFGRRRLEKQQGKAIFTHTALILLCFLMHSFAPCFANFDVRKIRQTLPNSAQFQLAKDALVVDFPKCIWNRETRTRQCVCYDHF